MYAANVAFVINRNYIGQFKVTFFSLINSNKDANFTVHLLHSDLTDTDMDDLRVFIGKYRADIKFYLIDDSVFEGLPKMGYDNSYTAYYKVLLPYYLAHLSKVLFLDCDIIVRGDISDLFKKNNSHFLSCVEDYKINRKRREHKKAIIGDVNSVYFNSGVMLFDFGKSEEITDKRELFDYVNANKESIKWHDQDIYNHFYAKNRFLLEEKYNYLTTYKRLIDVICPKGKKHAVIVHYANWKPWKSNYIGKYYKLYKKHYLTVKDEKGVDFLQKRRLSAQLKLIFGYIFR